MNADGLLTPAQRSAFEYNHYLHGIPRPDRSIYCWRTRRWYWCQVVDIGRREDFEPWRNVDLPTPWEKNKSGGGKGKERDGHTKKAIKEFLQQCKSATTLQIAEHLGLSNHRTAYKSLVRYPKLFERFDRGVEVRWRLRDNGRLVNGDEGQQTQRSTAGAQCTQG